MSIDTYIYIYIYINYIYIYIYIFVHINIDRLQVRVTFWPSRNIGRFTRDIQDFLTCH